MKFRTQIVSFGLAGIVLLGLTGGIGLVSTSRLGSAISESVESNVALTASHEGDMMHDALRGDAQRAMIGALTNATGNIDAAEKDYQDHARTLATAMEKLRSLPLSRESRESLASAVPLVQRYIDITGQFIQASKTDPTGAEKQMAAVQAAFAELEPRLAALTASIDKTNQQLSAEVGHSVDQTQMAIGISMAVAVVVLVVLATGITRAMLRQLGAEPQDAAALAQRVAAGDLATSIQLDSKDTSSLMAQLRAMQHSLAEVVSHVRRDADGVASASVQIAQGNQDLSNRTEEQASALEETATSMEELSSTVKQNADNARQGNQLAASASAVAVKGGEVVGQVVQTMKGINDSARKIADITSVIDSIAFQTNILALNAAVEAARAGEQGRGFAVVASEVRSLAGRSAGAAREIKALISASVDRVEQGTALADQAGATMTEVVSAIRRVADIMGEISAASNEQSVGVSQVGQAVTLMDQATQQNAALVEESAAAAETLKSQAHALVHAVSVFKLEQDGRPGSARAIATGTPALSQTLPPVQQRGAGRSHSVPRLAARHADRATQVEAHALAHPAPTRKVPSGSGDWETF